MFRFKVRRSQAIGNESPRCVYLIRKRRICCFSQLFAQSLGAKGWNRAVITKQLPKRRLGLRHVKIELDVSDLKREAQTFIVLRAEYGI